MPFIDCDSHVLEPQGLWRQYLEPGVPVPLAYCDYAVGDPLTFGAGIRIPGCPDMPVGRPFGMRYSFPGLSPSYEEYAGGTSPPTSTYRRWTRPASTRWSCTRPRGCT